MEIEILINDNEEKLNKEYKIQKNDNNNTDNNIIIYINTSLYY